MVCNSCGRVVLDPPVCTFICLTTESQNNENIGLNFVKKPVYNGLNWCVYDYLFFPQSLTKRPLVGDVLQWLPPQTGTDSHNQYDHNKQ